MKQRISHLKNYYLNSYLSIYLLNFVSVMCECMCVCTYVFINLFICNLETTRKVKRLLTKKSLWKTIKYYAFVDYIGY